MPEGPEIRRSTDALDKVLRGKAVEGLSFGQSHLKRKAKQFIGQKIASVQPRGKAVITQFSEGFSIYSHNQLYGEWAVFKRGTEPATHKQRRLVIETTDHVAVLYSASDIEILRSEAVHRHPYVAKLGVELLDAQTKLATVKATLNVARWQKKSLAQILLDQGFLAGVGNYLRSEILYAARIHPEARIVELSPAQTDALAVAALKITRQAYRLAGITNDPARVKKLKQQGMSFDRYRHWVFDREGEPCWTCDTIIERRMLAGRQLHWCVRCQGS